MNRHFVHVYADGTKVTLRFRVDDKGVSVTADPDKVAPEHEAEYLIWHDHVIKVVNESMTQEEETILAAWQMAKMLGLAMDEMVAKAAQIAPVAPVKSPRKRRRKTDSS